MHSTFWLTAFLEAAACVPWQCTHQCVCWVYALLAWGESPCQVYA